LSSRTYTGAKAFALRGTLLDRNLVEKLAESTSLDEVVNRLRGTSYNKALTGLTPPFSARRLEVALRERLAEVHHSILSTAGKFPILELYYLRHIAWDLKLALKSRALGRTYEEMLEFLNMKAEELVGRRDLIVKILTAKDVNEAVSLLSGSEFSEDAEKALASFNATGEARFFDVFIDHAVLSRISKEYSKNRRLYSSSRATDVAGVGEIVAEDVDAYNVLSVLRSKLWGLPEQEVKSLIITPTYRVTHSVLSRMVSTESVPEAARLLGGVVPAVPQTGQSDEQSIDLVEDAFTDAMKQTASRAFVWQGLSPGTALALVRLLEFEVSDLSAIAIGVEAGIDPKRILSRLKQ
jgi:V/A-type H+-transporting ATPase subunit C